MEDYNTQILPKAAVKKKPVSIGIRHKLIFFSLLILAGNAFIGYSVYKSNQELLKSERFVKHSEQIIYQSENILSLGKDLETASRGFVITGDSIFLEPFFSAQTLTFGDIGELMQLTRDNPAQRQRVEMLSTNMRRHLNLSFQMIELRSRLVPLVSVYATAKEGKDVFDHIRQITNTIKHEEAALLEKRKQMNERSVKLFDRFSVGMFILIAAFTIVILIVTGDHLLRNEEKEKQAAQLMIVYKELDLKNKENIKRAEELHILNGELQKAEDNIRRFNEELEVKVRERTAQLEAVNNELESFSYSVSHDLRAPLRAVDGYARMLKEDYETHLEPEAGRLMNNIVGNARKMGQLIDDLLTFSRLGRKELVKMNIPMHNMVTNLCGELKYDANNPNVQFIVNDLHPAWGDSVVIKQVWINLLSNAVKFSSLNTTPIIEIGSSIEGKEIVYFVKDNGAGFDMRYANKLFAVFQRLHSDDVFEGTGVGLAIVHRILSKHQGRVWAEGKVNEGAIFYFSIPKKI